MSQPAKAQEPSMEEILASIRRIIADDDASKPAVKAAAPAAAAEPAPAAAQAPAPAAAPPEPPAERKEPDEPAAGAAALPQGEVGEQQSQDILELTESMTAPEIPSFQTIDGQSDVVFSDAPPHSEPPQHAPAAPRRQPPPNNGTERSLLSPSASAAVDSAFNTLAQTVLVHNARTLEDLVREMLRPMLKSWLDDNLPGMVERIVRAEIERVSRGRS